MLIEDMRNGPIARKTEEDNFADFDFGPSEKSEPKKYSLDDVIKAAIKEGKLSFAVRYAFQEGYVEKAHELYYKYFSNLKTKDKEEIRKAGFLANDIGLHNEAFKKFVRVCDYYRAISSAEEANINISVKYIELGINYLKDKACGPGIINLAEIVGQKNDYIKGLFLNILNDWENKGNYFEAGRMANAVGEYKRAMENYIKVGADGRAAESAEKAGLKERAKELYKITIKRVKKTHADHPEYIESIIKKANEI